MRSDEKASSTKKDDITADELLALLNKSMEYKSDAEPTRVVSQNKATGDALKIDDDVYEYAEEKLRSSDAITASDDSDLDIDALIEKFITKPRKEAAAAEAARIEAEPIEEEPIFDDAAQIGQVLESNGEIEAKELVTVAEIPFEDEAADVAELYVEPTPVEEYEDDSDVKVADDAVASLGALTFAENMSDEEVFSDDADEAVEDVPDLDTDTTAVFDISSIKKLAEDEASLDAAIDEAFARSETEVFTPVSDDAEAPEEVAETVYGQDATGEIDQTDLNLMLAFGMNEELKETVGEEQANAIEDNIMQRQAEAEAEQMDKDEKPFEFTSREQITEVLTKYKSKYYTLIIRMAAALAILIGVFLIENHSMLGLVMPKFMRPTSYPVVYAMIDLQLVVIAGVLVAKQAVDGIKNLVTLKPTPESLTAFALVMSVIYTFAVCLVAPMDGFRLFNLPVVFAVLLALIYEFMNLKRDVFSFNIISSKKKKFVVSPVSDATESLEREIFNEYLPEESQIIRVGKTDFVDGFFSRVKDKRISKPIIGITLPVVLILAIGFLIVSFIKSGSIYEAFTMAFLTVAVTMPLTTFVIYSYPFYKASKDSYECDSAIVGESSFGEYSASSVISFEDKEVFPSGGVKVTSIKVYGNNRIDEIIYCLASAFMKIGGPLADVFSQATHDLGHSEDVELIEVDDDGFTVTIDDIPVHIGKATYMEKKDYEPPFDSEGRKREQASAVGVLYIAFGGQLTAKIYVQYTIDSEFESILAQLYKTGMCVGIKSFDPNIDDLLLAKKIKAMKYPVKVIRSKTVEDIPHTFERADSGIVSKRSVKALLKTVALCERVSGVIKTNLIVKLLAMLIGVVVMIFVAAFSKDITLTSLYVMLYQLFWTIPVIVISKLLV